MKRLAILIMVFLAMAVASCACATDMTVFASVNAISVYLENGQYGFIRNDGNRLTEAVFDHVTPFATVFDHVAFSDGCSIVCQGELWGVIDETGNTIIPCEYDDVYFAYASGTDKRFIVSKDGKTGILNEAGMPICDLKYDGIRGYYAGSAIVELDGLMGLIDLDGHIIVPPAWEWIYYMTDGWALVSFEVDGESHYSFVNRQNERMAQTYVWAEPFSEGLAFVMTEDSRTMIDPSGQPAFQNNWDDVHNVCSQALIGVCKDGRWGYVSPREEVIIPPQWDEAEPFSPEGLAKVKRNGLYGFIDVTGTVVIEPRWKESFGFHNGYAIVGDGQSYGIIDTTGEVVVPVVWPEVGYPSEGLISVQNADGLCGFIDLTGTQVIDCRFSFRDSFENGCALVVESETDQYIWINRAGEMVCPFASPFD